MTKPIEDLALVKIIEKAKTMNRLQQLISKGSFSSEVDKAEAIGMAENVLTEKQVAGLLIAAFGTANMGFDKAEALAKSMAKEFVSEDSLLRRLVLAIH